MKSRIAHCWYRFQNLFRTKPGPGEPLIFSCGSEAELRQVTTWACHLYPGLFDIVPVIHITYSTANDEVKTARRQEFRKYADHERACAEPYYEAFSYWIGLAFLYNEFTGTEWIRPENIQLYNEPGFPGYRPGLPTRLGIVEWGVSITVEVHPPSAQEHAQAMQGLREWLEDKGTEDEKRQLLPTSDDVAA